MLTIVVAYCSPSQDSKLAIGTRPTTFIFENVSIELTFSCCRDPLRVSNSFFKLFRSVSVASKSAFAFARSSASFFSTLLASNSGFILLIVAVIPSLANTEKSIPLNLAASALFAFLRASL